MLNITSVRFFYGDNIHKSSYIINKLPEVCIFYLWFYQIKLLLDD